MPIYLLCDVGSTYTKTCVVDTDQELVLATASSFTTSDTDIAIGIENAKKQMSLNPDIHIDQTLVCSSAKGGLKMIAVGLVPDLTLKAATLACFSAGAKVIGSYAFELNDKEVSEIEHSTCDILLLCGGTDGGNTQVVLHNAKKLSMIKRRFPIIYAGNKSCQDEIKDIFKQYGFDCTLCANVMPEYGKLAVEECREIIRDIFLAHIVKAKGLSRLNSLIGDIVLPTPYAVLEALKRLSQGTKNEKGIGDLMAVDIGGATTDVYSINDTFVLRDNVGYKGLREPLAKRSVEGDLGVRFNAHSLYELKKDERIEEGFVEYVASLANDVHRNENPTFDQLLAKGCAEIAFSRHAGRLETVYTPMGVGYYQSGKDLRDVRTLIGIGGPILHSQDPQEILAEALYRSDRKEILLPAKLEYFIDASYIVSCMGLLASRHPDTVVRILKKNLEKINDEQQENPA